MSEKLYITLAGNNIAEFPGMIDKLKDAYPERNWVEKTPIYSMKGDFWVNGKLENQSFLVQKFETE